MITIETNKMSVEEKILGMEVLWEDLCNQDNIDSPDWHKDVLLYRENIRNTGEQNPMEWKEAKREILNKI
jgi:hypothetical protein